MSARSLRQALADLIASDGARMIALKAVRSLTLQDCWSGAGFVRNAVWDHLHGYPANLIGKDVDVVWFDPALTDPDIDRAVDERLARLAPGLC